MMIGRLRQLFSPPTPEPVVPPVFTLPEGVRVYAVGDIHGRSDLLSKMLQVIAKDVDARPVGRVVEVFLGDYVDRGLHSREVIDLLLAPPASGHERVCLLGNHEDALLQFLENPNLLREWGGFGGYATLASYGIAIPSSMAPAQLALVRDLLRQRLSPTHLGFIENLPLSYQLGDYLFVHAGIAPKKLLAEQTRDDFLWIRDAFLKHQGYFEQYVVHGHSPIAAPQILANRTNIDVSNAAVNSLCCLIIEGGDRKTLLVTD